MPRYLTRGGGNFNRDLLTKDGFIEALHKDDYSPAGPFVKLDNVSREQLSDLYDALGTLSENGKVSQKELEFLASLGDGDKNSIDKSDIKAITDKIESNTIEFAKDSRSTFINGKWGQDGVDGKWQQAKDGIDSKDGQDGITINGKDYIISVDGKPVKDSKNPTPVYFDPKTGRYYSDGIEGSSR